MARPASHDWPVVLNAARVILEESGPLSRPDLWAEIVRRGLAAPHGGDGFRAAVLAAQKAGEFPPLPRARTGPTKGTAWTDDRHAAELVRKDEPTPLELYTERTAECLRLLSTLAGVVTVHLSPRTFAIFAAKGFGQEMVAQAVQTLVAEGLAELRWEVTGIQRMPVVRAA